MLNLAQFAGQYVDDDNTQTSPNAVQSIAQFTREYGGDLEQVGTVQKYLLLLSILDYLGTADPTYSMQDAVCFQDGDGYLSAGIDEDSPDNSLSEWLQHFATLAEEAESNSLLWGIASTLFEQLKGG